MIFSNDFKTFSLSFKFCFQFSGVIAFLWEATSVQRQHIYYVNIFSSKAILLLNWYGFFYLVEFSVYDSVAPVQESKNSKR